jgi:CRISPR system Cascade subunit CasE
MTTVDIDKLYLSRILLDSSSRQVMSELAHPYEMHRTLMRAFPNMTNETQSEARDEFGVLFRAEVDGLRRAVKVYVQSRIEPNWSFLNGLNDYLCADTGMPQYEHKDIMPACRKLHNGQVLSFRLRANPTRRIAKQDDLMRGKRVELVREEEQIEWLVRKGRGTETHKSGGFEILTNEVKNSNGGVQLIPRVNVCCEGKQKGRKRQEERSCETIHLAVRFDGLLRITDVDAFRETLSKGIGPGKAFGFGLLSVAPVKSSSG